LTGSSPPSSMRPSCTQSAASPGGQNPNRSSVHRTCGVKPS
jgi:hypothetical protein